LDPDFARDYLKWQSVGHSIEVASEAELIMEFCRALNLDLVCIPAKDPASTDTCMSESLNNVRWFADQEIFVFWIVNGSFQTAMEHLGLLKLLMEIAAAPNEVAKKLQRLSNQVVATMVQGLNAGAHGIIIADDIAFQQSTLMSPHFVQQHLLPIWQSQAATAKNLKAPVFFHSDGNLNAVMPCIVEAGFNGLQCIEPSAGMDIVGIKRNYGKDLCLMGNIDPSHLSVSDCSENLDIKKQELRRAVMELLACDDGQGGLIVGTCSGIHAGMSPEYVNFMYQLVSDLESSK
jgi:uroporphyrinogen decarboxylase